MQPLPVKPSPIPNGVDSPSRQLLSETRRRRHIEGSPIKSGNNADSPSRQLIDELSRLRLETAQDFKTRLDQQYQEREQIHREQLAAAAIEHDSIRQSAERAAQRHQLLIEEELRRRVDDEKRELERIKRDSIYREAAERKRRLEEVEREEIERRRLAEEVKALEEAEARRKVNQEEEEAERVKREADRAESDRKAREAAAAAEKAREPWATSSSPARTNGIIPAVTPSTNGVLHPKAVSGNLVSSVQKREVQHKAYLDLHKRLKEMRRYMVTEGKKNPELKKCMGNMRREIKKCVGQLTGEKGANTMPTKRIRTILEEASRFSNPSVDMTAYLISPPPVDPSSSSHVPGLLLYLLNIFSKACISQFIDEAGVAPKAADPIGLVAVTIFSTEHFKYRGHPLIDILLAKFHLVCPVLWGIYGDERTEGGRARLGWWREDAGGPWVTEQRHGERMTGLGAGFAALTLRDFSKARSENPCPNWHYWRSLSYIVNTPPQQATQTHFLVLKAMVESNVPRFIGFYGHAGLCALRLALVEFPERAGKSVAASAVKTLPDVLRRDYNLIL